MSFCVYHYVVSIKYRPAFQNVDQSCFFYTNCVVALHVLWYVKSILSKIPFDVNIHYCIYIVGFFWE